MHSTLLLLNVCVFCFCSICFLLFFNSGNLTIEENSSSRAGLKSSQVIWLNLPVEVFTQVFMCHAQLEVSWSARCQVIFPDGTL